jgi:DNA ligase D-like protein (predicted 3'-phosphoesterase)
VVVGGAPLAPALRRRAETAGVPVVDAYGLSETWGGFVLDGHPMPGAEVDVGPDGEIRARGPMILRGYRFDPGATDAALDAEGWFRTGDVGDWGADRRLRVVDRRRDLVITGGVNVSPTTVETVLAGHPDVADVCVTGAPDLDWGERVVAFVVPRAGRSVPTVEDLRSFGRDRLRAAELPRQVVDVDVIPRTAGGKAQRRRLPLPDEPAVPSTGVARDPLTEYVAKRDFVHTPEPGTEATGLARPGELRFVVQEHHARRLHWDLRLEHDGVLWSWAVPKGIPMRPKPNHLAVRTEDHPLPYLSFEGEIPAGQYGAGTMTVWDRGTYAPTS